MKVFIAVGVHPRYRRFIDYLPEGFEYEISGNPDVNKYYSPVRTGGTWKKLFSLRFASTIITRIFGFPRMTYYRTDADLIYSTRGILPLNRKPWIVELEHPYGFVGMDYRLWGRRQKAVVGHFLKSKYCKGIVVVTDAAKRVMDREFPDPKIKNKVHVIYTTVPYTAIKRKKHKGITLLMIANADIYGRGFRFLQSVYPELKRKYNINWILKTNQPFLEKDRNFVRTYGVKVIWGNFNEEQLNKLFGEADIFINLSFVDTNSNIMYEAMRAGLPIIAQDTFSGKEKIKNGYNGFVIPLPRLFWNKENMRITRKVDFSQYYNKEVSSILLDRIERLIKNKKLREQMGRRNKMLIKNGRFSMRKRIHDLETLFRSVINKSSKTKYDFK